MYTNKWIKHLKKDGKTVTNQTQSQSTPRNCNIRVEINEIKTKRMIQGLTNLTAIYLRR